MRRAQFVALFAVIAVLVIADQLPLGQASKQQKSKLRTAKNVENARQKRTGTRSNVLGAETIGKVEELSDENKQCWSIGVGEKTQFSLAINREGNPTNENIMLEFLPISLRSSVSQICEPVAVSDEYLVSYSLTGETWKTVSHGGKHEPGNLWVDPFFIGSSERLLIKVECVASNNLNNPPGKCSSALNRVAYFNARRLKKKMAKLGGQDEAEQPKSARVDYWWWADECACPFDSDDNRAVQCFGAGKCENKPEYYSRTAAVGYMTTVRGDELKACSLFLTGADGYAMLAYHCVNPLYCCPDMFDPYSWTAESCQCHHATDICLDSATELSRCEAKKRGFLPIGTTAPDTREYMAANAKFYFHQPGAIAPQAATVTEHDCEPHAQCDTALQLPAFLQCKDCDSDTIDQDPNTPVEQTEVFHSSNPVSSRHSTIHAWNWYMDYALIFLTNGRTDLVCLSDTKRYSCPLKLSNQPVAIGEQIFNIHHSGSVRKRMNFYDNQSTVGHVAGVEYSSVREYPTFPLYAHPNVDLWYWYWNSIAIDYDISPGGSGSPVLRKYTATPCKQHDRATAEAGGKTPVLDPGDGVTIQPGPIDIGDPVEVSPYCWTSESGRVVGITSGLGKCSDPDFCDMVINDWGLPEWCGTGSILAIPMVDILQDISPCYGIDAAGGLIQSPCSITIGWHQNQTPEIWPYL